MVIVHIAKIGINEFGGVHIVVPQHILAQRKYADVAFINLTDYTIPNINQIANNGNIDFLKFSKPYNRPDLIVFHEIYFWQYVFISSKLRKLKIPYIIISHGSLTDEAQKKSRIKKIIANKLVFNKFINNAIAIQCLSKLELQTTNFPVRKFIGTNGIYPSLKHKEYFNKERIKFVYIGRYDIYYKGLDLLIEAIAKIADILRKNNASIDLYGPINRNKRSFDYLNSLALKLKISDLVIFNDSVKNNEKEKILLDADVFIQTSRTEGMPLGIIEAMNYGLPCLITRGAALGELINKYDAGWVSETNSEDIAKQIYNAIYEQDKWINKSINARKLILENFNWDNIALQTIKEYKKYV